MKPKGSEIDSKLLATIYSVSMSLFPVANFECFQNTNLPPGSEYFHWRQQLVYRLSTFCVLKCTTLSYRARAWLVYLVYLE